MMILADSNIVIYAASGQYPKVADWFSRNVFAVSAVSLVEVLGYHNLKPEQKWCAGRFIFEFERLVSFTRYIPDGCYFAPAKENIFGRFSDCRYSIGK